MTLGENWYKPLQSNVEKLKVLLELDYFIALSLFPKKAVEGLKLVFVSTVGTGGIRYNRNGIIEIGLSDAHEIKEYFLSMKYLIMYMTSWIQSFMKRQI